MSAYEGKFVWYELMTSDARAAEAFYAAAIGWQAKDAGMPGQSYTLFSAGPAMVGGLMGLPQDARARGVGPCWTGYVAVADVDAMARRVTDAGGSVHRAPDDIPGIGRFAVVADPQGAVFMLFRGQGEPPPAPPGPGVPGHVGWHELHTTDREAGFAFYAGLFGWTRSEAVDMGPMGIYQTWAAAGPAIGGMFTKGPGMPGPFWLFYFNVAAIDAAIARVAQAGGKVAHGPMQVPGGSWIAQCFDPQGAMFAMVAPQR